MHKYKPLPPPPWYAPILWLAPCTMALVLTMACHARDGVSLFKHDGGMSCDQCCDC